MGGALKPVLAGYLSRLLVEPARPAWLRRRAGAHWLAVATVCVGAFMGQLDASIVTLALPSLRGEFHASLGAVGWVALAYLIALAGSIAAVGRLADMVGRKLLYTYGFVVFALASVGCALAPGLGWLVGLRALQGVGAALLQANSVALVAASVPSGSLGRALGLQGAAQAAGLALGPSVGGLLIGVGGWRLIFLVNAPVGLVGVVLGWFFLPRSRGLAPRQRFDWPGLVLFLPAIGCLLFGLSEASRAGAAAGAGTLGFLAAALVLGVAFVTRERHTHAPMINLGLLRRRAFSAGLVSAMICYLTLFGTLLVAPFQLEGPLGLSPGGAGLVLSALPLAIGLVAPAAGALADRRGGRALALVGLALAACALALMALAHRSAPFIAGELALVGAGVGLFSAPNNAVIMAQAPLAQAGLAGGLVNLTRTVGTALGVSVGALALALGGPAAAGVSGQGGFGLACLVLGLVAAVGAGVSALGGARRRGGAVPGEGPWP